MDFKLYSHRNALEIAESSNYRKDWASFCEVISSVSDDDLKAAFRALGVRRAGRKKEGQKSLSQAMNRVLREKLQTLGWEAEPALFAKDKAGLGPNGWKLDFVRRKPDAVGGPKVCSYAVEVAFNHSEAAAWVLTKLALACEPTSMAKEVEATVGILVVMQADLKRAGNFDSACCTYDRYLQTIGVMNDLLRAPLIVVGLGAPRNFRLKGHPRGVRIVGVIEDV